MTVHRTARFVGTLAMAVGAVAIVAAVSIPPDTYPSAIPSHALSPPSSTAPAQVGTYKSTPRAYDYQSTWVPRADPVQPSPTPAPVPQEAPVEQPAPAPAPATPETIWLEPVTALGDQGAVDEGHLVTWMTSPTCLLAGHDYAGWAWMSSVPVGTRIEVTAGPCAGTYEVYGHNGHDWRGGPVPEWMSGVDLVLQTCTPNGTGFSLARSI